MPAFLNLTKTDPFAARFVVTGWNARRAVDFWSRELPSQKWKSEATLPRRVPASGSLSRHFESCRHLLT